MGRPTVWVLLGLTLLAVSLHDTQVTAEVGPSESECRPYIEKAIHDLKTTETSDEDIDEDFEPDSTNENNDNNDDVVDKSREIDDNQSDDEERQKRSTDNTYQSEEELEDSDNGNNLSNSDSNENIEESNEETSNEINIIIDSQEADNNSNEQEIDRSDKIELDESTVDSVDTSEEIIEHEEINQSPEKNSEEDIVSEQTESVETEIDNQSNNHEMYNSNELEVDKSSEEDVDKVINQSSQEQDLEERVLSMEAESVETDIDTDTNNQSQSDEHDNSDEIIEEDSEKVEDTTLNTEPEDNNQSDETNENNLSTDEESIESEQEVKISEQEVSVEDLSAESQSIESESSDEQELSLENLTAETQTTESDEASIEEKSQDIIAEDDQAITNDSTEEDKNIEEISDVELHLEDETNEMKTEEEVQASEASVESHPEDDLLLEYEIPTNLRDRSHIAQILKLDDEFLDKENALNKVADVILKDLKKIYENAIKPLETTYKYRDLSNRHFGDPEIFSKPLILFMGPWSGGKSTILNYLSDNEYTPNSIRSGAEPSPAYFNILMHGSEPEVLDGTQLAADWTFSGLQKFGQGLEDRLRGLKLPSKILEKVNIVEIPGILEVRKQVSRLFPFNDACQWFIDRADIIFLVYDPSKLDVGPETEAILDQLKGREYQTRIILNKADQVKPEELMRVQGALIWNISPLMSSAQPPIMYTTSLWSNPMKTGAPVRLLQSQERSLLLDLRVSIDKRIENKIASARRFAVRVRNHAKMVDCYLTTYYNHKSLFGNKKQIADQIIEHPQNYHIYEGLSTLTNISRYDLPDPEVYRDFFRLNPLYEFKKLSETCTYFRGCPINKLDIAIAYDLPELVGKYKKALEVAFNAVEKENQPKVDSDKS